jgi:Flp pilus assembly pilin Flp
MRTLQSLLWSERSGTTAIEYALIVLLIGLVIISLQNSIGPQLFPRHGQRAVTAGRVPRVRS